VKRRTLEPIEPLSHSTSYAGTATH
jgi:hypothetical protein